MCALAGTTRFGDDFLCTERMGPVARYLLSVKT
jgi:hypothetical protein